MATKKTNNSYIGMELEWLDKKAAEIREYCNQPIHKIVDRKDGQKVIAKKEDIIKSIRETLKDYIQIIASSFSLRVSRAAIIWM